MIRSAVFILAGLFVMAGCSSSSGTAYTDAGYLHSDWLVLDLTTGTTEPRREINASDAAYRDRLMLFRRIPAGRFVPGVLGTDIGDTDEKGRVAINIPQSWLGAFEVTQAQWARLTAAPAPAVDGTLPMAVTRGQVDAMLLSQAAAGRRFDLPDGDLWEYAAGAGTGNSFAWGTSLADRDGTAFAVFNPNPASSLTAPTGPSAVGSKRANAWGIFDMQGNLWEHVSSSASTFEARGGCWAHPLVTARASNRLTIRFDQPHPLIGVRLAWSE